MHFDPRTMNRRQRYKLTIGTVIPRPIAWVSSIDAEGRPNLAPYSYFNAVCDEPMTMMFAPQIPLATGEKKDTLKNIEAVPEFVINLTNEATAVAMNKTATNLPHGESEFDYAGVTPVASTTIRVPRVAEAPVAFECKLQQIVTINPSPGGGAMVLGEVTAIHIADEIYDREHNYVLVDKMQPIGRLAGREYTRVTDIFELIRERR